MIIFKKADQLSGYLGMQRKTGKAIGFVPTMGALHEGHLSLVQMSGKSNDITVCSVFINPTQFNNAEDFRLYPVTIEKDIEKLVRSGCDILFLPSTEEVYPPGHEKKNYELGELEFVLEGRYRPGHFQGVCEVLDRFLQIINPQRIYLGRKDLQQCLVVEKMLALTGRHKLELVMAPTVREPDGLAMSSRNLRLTDVDRKKAPVLYRELSRIRDQYDPSHEQQLAASARANIENAGFRVDYVEFADTGKLTKGRENGNKSVLLAATIGDIRLIDNLELTNTSPE